MINAKTLLLLKRFEESRATLQAGLEWFPCEIKLIKYLRYVNCYLGIEEKTMDRSESDNIRLCPEDLITYSSTPHFFEILQSKRSACVNNYVVPKKHVFIAGLGRSGTTALGKLLNISSSVEIYTELYSFLGLRAIRDSIFQKLNCWKWLLRIIVNINLLNCFQSIHHLKLLEIKGLTLNFVQSLLLMI